MSEWVRVEIYPYPNVPNIQRLPMPATPTSFEISAGPVFATHAVSGMPVVMTDKVGQQATTPPSYILCLSKYMLA